MSFIQQNQREIEGEFETSKLEIQTISTPFATQTKTNLKNHPRAKLYSEKQRLGLKHHAIQTQPHVPATNEPIKVPIGKIIKIGTATFRSNFESGSIGSVELIGSNSYVLRLDHQTNSTRLNTWFYFSVQGVKAEANFTIKGFSKKTSLYNEGMKLCYRDSKQSNKWRRGGLKIKYEPYTEGQEQCCLYCLKFSYFFKSNQFSSVEFAYSFPYGINKLNFLLSNLQPKIKVHSLGQSYEERSIPFVTLGNLKSKEMIIVSARVHPGQSISSFIAQGFLKQVIGDSQHAIFLKEKFFIMVIPMINVDGVARGNYRFSATGADLNRKWKQPHEQFHPQIYLLKQMILRESKQRNVRMFIDLHGHSRKKNLFFYGCCPHQDPNGFSKAKAFPFLMSKFYNFFNYQSCSFNLQKDKEGTARIALFKEFKIYQIFTLQASFCGLNNGPNFIQSDYQNIGRKLCEGIGIYFVDPNTNSFKSLGKLLSWKEQKLSQLVNNSQFLNIGNQQDIGSDSDPERGQGKPRHAGCLHQKHDFKKQKNKVHQKSFSKNVYSLKQKSQPASQNIKQLRDIQPYLYLFQPPTQTLDADFSKQSTTSKNQRVHSISKQTRPQAKIFSNVQSISYADAGVFGVQKQFEKIKINLLIGKQGAQYRRVRKIVEQSYKFQKSQSNFYSLNHSKGNKVQMQKGLKVMPKLCLDQQNKHRKTTAEMYFHKPLRLQETLQKSNMNVLCRGRQIFF